MANLSEEEQQRILNSRPWATFIIMMLLLAIFMAGWAYMYFFMFLEQGPLH